MSEQRKSPLYRIGWVDGHLINRRKLRVPIDSPTVQYGIALFEGLIGYPLEGGIGIVGMEEHCTRLFDSMVDLQKLFPKYPLMRICRGETCEMDVIVDDGRIYEGIRELIKANEVDGPVYIRPTLFHRSGGDVRLRQALQADCSLGIFLQRWDGYLPEGGLRTVFGPWRKASSPIASRKFSSNYGLGIVTKQWAIEQGFHEAILLDEKGLVAEGTSENLIIEYRDGRLVTPTLVDRPILPGITLRILRETIAPHLGLKIEEADVTPNDLFNEASGFLLTGTAAEVGHVTELHDYTTGFKASMRVYNGGQPTERLRALIDGYRQLIRGEGPESYRRHLTFVRP